ncbi:hypothetical protein D1821_19040 (plasmid) [Phaeobacter inhibens]|uniref:hypothetical protein n=2 Tax=Roseobacteraceae TaxID=2854170 RepID=UPI0005C6F55D|nr:hypothetical protein [Phaeobacter inhibens]AXT44581.1 hypothetical protein D1821_19040 [Phaeobacter inhibens]
MLSEFQWAVAVVGAIVFVTLVMAMLRTRGGITLRRLIALLVTAILIVTVLWFLGGATTKPGRTLTLIAHCQTSSDDIKASLARLQPNGGSVVIFLFHARKGVADQTSCPALPVLSGSTTVPPIAHVGAAQAGSVQELLTLAKDSKPSGLAGWWISVIRSWSTETMVFLYDPTLPDWDLIGAADRKQSRTALSMYGGEIFIVDVQREASAYSLSVAIGPQLRVGQRYSLQQGFVDLSVLGGALDSAAEQPTMAVDLCISLNRTTSFTECELAAADRILLEGIELQREATSLPRWTWYPGGNRDVQRSLALLMQSVSKAGISLGDARVVPGWQFLELKARIADGPNEGLVLPPNTVYLNADAVGPAILSDGTALISRAWPKPLFNPYFALFDQSWRARISRRLQDLPPVPEVIDSAGGISRCLLIASAVTDAMIEDCATAAGALVVLEPSADTIKRLTDLEIPKRLLARGVPILIAPPPVKPSTGAAPLEGWMPAWADTNGVAGPRVRRTTRSIAFISDCSGLSHIPLETKVENMMDTISERPIDRQKAIVDQLTSALVRLAGYASAPVERNGTRQLVLRLEAEALWEPAVQIQTKPGCLRAVENEMITPSALVETAGLAERLNAFLSGLTVSAAPFAAFEPGNAYPGSVVVVFTTQAAQLPPANIPTHREGGAVEKGHLASSYTSSPVGEAILQQFKDAGVRVLLVVLPTSNEFADAADAAAVAVGGETWGSALARWRTAGLVETLMIPKGQLVSESVSALLKRLALAPGSGGAVAEPVLRGRSLDPRTPSAIEVLPSMVLGLEAVADAETLIRGSAGSSLAGLPLALARYDLGAPVVALAYSPFDPAIWASDDLARTRIAAAFIEACSPGCELETWIRTFSPADPTKMLRMGGLNQSSALGIQRLIDIVEQAGWSQKNHSRLQLIGVEVSRQQDAAEFHFRIPPGTGSWPVPRLRLADAGLHCGTQAQDNTCPLSLTEIDPSRGRVVYRLSTTNPRGFRDDSQPAFSKAFELQIGATSDAPVDTLPIRLLPRVALVAGGSPFQNLMLSEGAASLVGNLPVARRSAVTLVMFLMFGAILALFSPLVRRWHAFSRFWKRGLRRLPPLGFDADIVSERAGHLTSRVEASRRAGDPSWMRPFQSGDNLSRAIVADLVGLTSVGKKMGFSARRPRVRLREIGESFDLIIGIDDAPAMLHPGDFSGRSRKRAVVEALVAIVGRAVDQQGGRWSIVGLRSGHSIEPTKVMNPETVSELMTVFFDSTTHKLQPDVKTSSAETIPHLLISDFLSLPPKAYADWIGPGGGAILIGDSAQAQELGLGYDASTMVLYDRSAWEPRDVKDLLLRRRLDARHSVERVGGVFAEIDVDASDLEVAETLTTSGVLGLARR